MCCGLKLLLEVEGDVAQLLLDVTVDFTPGGGVERVATLRQVLDEEIREITSSKVKTEDGVGWRETLVDGDYVRANTG